MDHLAGLQIHGCCRYQGFSVDVALHVHRRQAYIVAGCTNQRAVKTPICTSSSEITLPRIFQTSRKFVALNLPLSVWGTCCCEQNEHKQAQSVSRLYNKSHTKLINNLSMDCSGLNIETDSTNLEILDDVRSAYVHGFMNSGIEFDTTLLTSCLLLRDMHYNLCVYVLCSWDVQNDDNPGSVGPHKPKAQH